MEVNVSATIDSFVKKSQKWWWFKRFSFSKQVQFVSYLNSWLDCHASELQACDAMLDAYGPQTVEYKVASRLREFLTKGMTLADGMRDWFHPNIVSVFSSATRSGDKSLRAILEEFIEFEAVKKSVRKSFMQPLKVPLVLTTLMLFTAIPSGILIGMVEARHGDGFEYNWSMYLTLGLSELLSSYLLFTIFLLVVTSFFAMFYAKTSVSKFRLNFLDHTFPFNIYREFSAMQLLSTIGLLVKEGDMTPKQAAKEVYPDATEYQKNHLEKLILSDGRGKQALWQLFDTGLLNSLTLTRLKILSDVKKESVRKEAILNSARKMKEDTLNRLEGIRGVVVFTAWLLFAVLGVSNALSMLSALTQF